MDATTPLTPEAQRKQDRARKRKAILAGGVVLGLGAAVTLAAWSDDVFADGTFTTGSFELQGSIDGGTTWLDNDSEDPADLTFALYPTDIAPGDINYAPLSVGVEGTQDALVTIPTVTGTNTALDPHLSYTIYTGVAAASCNAAGVSGAAVAYAGAIGAAPTTSTPVTAPQLSTVTTGTPLCITVLAEDTQELPQAASTTIEWQFTGTSVEGT